MCLDTVCKNNPLFQLKALSTFKYKNKCNLLLGQGILMWIYVINPAANERTSLKLFDTTYYVEYHLFSI